MEVERVARICENRFEALRRIIPHNIIGFETATMQEVVHKILTERSLTLATAESCTGGSIAARFTAMPGASAYFLCGVVSYSNESKAELLIETLYRYFLQHPTAMSPDYQAIAERFDLDRAVCDYISGMTDQYAIYKFEEYFVPKAWNA